MCPGATSSARTAFPSVPLSSGTAGLGLRAWTCGSPCAPLDPRAQSGGISNPHGQLERGTPPASCMVSPPGTPGCCAVRAQGNNHSPGMLCGWGKPWVSRRAPGTLAQPVARKHHLAEKHPPPLHTYHIRLLLLQPASLSRGPQAAREEAAVLSSGLELGCRKEQAAPLPAPGLYRVLAMAP